MKRPKIWRRLNDALHAGTCVTVTRGKIRDWPFYGFVVGLSEDWALFHYVDGDFLRFNGYYAVRVRDITAIRPDASIKTRVLQLNNEFPVPQPDVLLLDLPGLLSSASALFSLVRVDEEVAHPDDGGYIGRIVKVGKRFLTIRCVLPNATWTEAPTSYFLKGVTSVTFGDAYNAALLRLLQEETPFPSP